MNAIMKRGSGLSYGEIQDRIFQLPPKPWTPLELAEALGIPYGEARATLVLMVGAGLAAKDGLRRKTYHVVFPR